MRPIKAMRTTAAMRARLRELATEPDDFDRAVLMLLDDFDDIARAGCPSGLAACELNRKPLPPSLELPRSSTYAIEDRDGTDAGLRRTAGRDDDGTDNHHEQRRPDEVGGLARDVGRDRAPSVRGAEQSEVGYGTNHFDAFWRMIDAETAASSAPATKDTPRALDLGGDIRRQADDAAMGGGSR